MWTCPKCRSQVDDSHGICGSCGSSPEGEEDPSRTRACKAGPFPDSPDSGSPLEFEDGVHGPPPEWIECYRTGNLADATLMAGYLRSHGINARMTRDNGAQWGYGCFEGDRVLVRAKDFSLARRLMERIKRRRARRQHPAESPRNAFDPLFVFMFCFLGGFTIGVVIGQLTGWERVCAGVGAGFGFGIGLFLRFRSCRARKRADAGIPVAKATVSGIE
jgi:hypothetical protein